MDSLLMIQVVMYSAALWFGLYMLARGGGKPGMQAVGGGLLSYALSVLLASLGQFSPPLGTTLAMWYPLLALLPAMFWFGAAWSLLPASFRAAVPANRPLLLAALIVIGAGLAIIGGVGQWALMAVPTGLALMALWQVWRAFRSGLPRPPLKVLFTATLFFALGSGLLVLPLELVSEGVVLLAIGGDLALLGYAIARLDAYDEGTALLPDMLRSLVSVGAISVLIGAQVFALVGLGGHFSVAQMALGYAALTSVILLLTLHSSYQRLLDRLLFGEKNRLVAERETLMNVSDALPRLDEAASPLVLDEAEFVRLTRRALSHLNDPGKLVASPLTRLPGVTARLRADGRPDTSLERAQEVRRLLTEHILRLKPYSDKDFDTGDEWRYYNVLYFPYVVGLKPYTARPQSEATDAAAQQALDWFQTHVPERTLYNWQTAAARLIAQQLRESDALLLNRQSGASQR